MEIIGEFYKLTPIDDSSPRYDLELLREIGGKNPRKEFKPEAYGISLESAINRIILFATRKHFEEEVVTLKQYLDVYKEETNKIRTEFS